MRTQQFSSSSAPLHNPPKLNQQRPSRSDSDVSVVFSSVLHKTEKGDHPEYDLYYTSFDSGLPSEQKKCEMDAMSKGPSESRVSCRPWHLVLHVQTCRTKKDANIIIR